MGRDSTITQEQVNAAADDIRSSGANPTARSVREKIGSTGSMATILKFLRVWKDRQNQPSNEPLTLTAGLQRVIRDFLEQEVAAARKELEVELVSARQETSDLIVENERQSTTIELQAKALDTSQVENATAVGRLAQVESELARANDDVIAERKTGEYARTELAKALLRLEAVPSIEAGIMELRAGLETERLARVAAEQCAAVAVARFEAESAQRIKLEARLADCEKNLTNANSEAVLAAEALGKERVTAQAFQAQLEVAVRDLDLARKAIAEVREMAKKKGEEAAELRGKLEVWSAEPKKQPSRAAR